MKPPEENIHGAVEHKHTYSHSVQWEYVIGFVGLLVVAVLVYRTLEDETAQNAAQGAREVVGSSGTPSPTTVAIEGVGGGLMGIAEGASGDDQ